jgi:hypothetical protein
VKPKYTTTAKTTAKIALRLHLAGSITVTMTPR